jgi:hypothetical protein
VEGVGQERPIKVIWSREDDIKGGYYRPSHVHRADIGVDAKGEIVAWDHVIVGQSIVTGTPFEPMMVKDGVDATMIEGMGEPYDVPLNLSGAHRQGQCAGAVVAFGRLDPHGVRDGDPDRRSRARGQDGPGGLPQEADGRKGQAPPGRAGPGGRQVRLRQEGFT